MLFTGHRPEKLLSSEEVVKEELEQAIRQTITDGFTVFLSGMARGVDLWAASETNLRLPLLRDGTLPLSAEHDIDAKHAAGAGKMTVTAVFFGNAADRLGADPVAVPLGGLEHSIVF